TRARHGHSLGLLETCRVAGIPPRKPGEADSGRRFRMSRARCSCCFTSSNEVINRQAHTDQKGKGSMLSISLPEPVIIHRPIDVINALHELSPELDVEVLREAALVGESFRDSCTENDPLSAPGFLAWARTVRALRELLIPRGFKRAFTDPYFPLVLSP